MIENNASKSIELILNLDKFQQFILNYFLPKNWVEIYCVSIPEKLEFLKKGYLMRRNVYWTLLKLIQMVKNWEQGINSQRKDNVMRNFYIDINPHYACFKI